LTKMFNVSSACPNRMARVQANHDLIRIVILLFVEEILFSLIRFFNC